MKHPSPRLLFLLMLLPLVLSLACGSVSPNDDSATAPNPPADSAPVDSSDMETARVVNVVDGDTIDVLLNGQEYRVRYILVNTPETKHPTKGVEPFGPEASEANKALVEGKTVYLEKDVSETDQYGRLLRYVYTDDFMVNEELLRRGLAQVSTFPPDVKYVDRFLDVQREAQQQGAGMWGEIAFTPVPPKFEGDSPVIIIGVDVYDEYVDLQNTTRDTQRLAGWRLVSERGEQSCELDGIIRPNTVLRVWAQAADADKGGFNCGFGQGVWSNSNPDPAVLYDNFDREVSRFE